MPRRSSKNSNNEHRTPKVRLARPGNRPFQLRYRCPVEQREIRISTGTRDEREAQQQKAELEAKLLLGLDVKPGQKNELGPNIDWEEFRECYRNLHLATLREGSAEDAESRLDIAQSILKPRRLADVADASALHHLQAKLLAGVKSKRGKARSPHTVRGYMTSVLAAVNWAHLQGWLPQAPKVRKLKVSKFKAMRGRPITPVEFEAMLKATSEVVGQEAAESWHYLLRGLWESALRLDELMHVSWDLPGTIRPIWAEGQFPVLEIPAALQKNDTEESIPLLPSFEKLLLQTPTRARTGWIFSPISLQNRIGRGVRHERSKSKWIGKIIARIGKKANVLVEPANERTGQPIKFATAHDLRRSCGERLRQAGVPPLVICRVMRHSSWDTTRKHYAPGDVQDDARLLVKVLQPAN